MINQLEFGGLKKGRFWINELPEIRTNLDHYLSGDLQGGLSKIPLIRQICCELVLLPRETSYYGLLGMTFTPLENKMVEYKVAYSDEAYGYFKNPLYVGPENIFCGLNLELAEAVFETINESDNSQQWPSGLYYFSIGAYSRVGSSKFVFKKLARIILNVFIENQESINELLIKSLIQNEINSRK